MTDEMREFVDDYVNGSQRQRLLTLHRSLRSPAFVGVKYDPDADGSAADVWRSGAANCLSYAHLFVAMARYAGLDARYLSVSLRPEWSRHGDQVALRKHVNVRVRLRSGEEYVVDIDPVARERIASAKVLRDEEAFALYHGNRAMGALLQQQRERAYAEAVRAISLGGSIDYLWVNLGAIYRQTGQDEAAEAMYRAALELNPDSPTAMNNMAVLYATRGQLQESRHWEERVRKRRTQNPFYHYYLGEVAEADGDLDTALSHYLDAIALKETESEFYFRVARLYLAMQRREQSRSFAEKAIEHSRLVGERREYQLFLNQLDSKTVVTAQLQGG
jgi:Tfp pilus assembly protein PilF